MRYVQLLLHSLGQVRVVNDRVEGHLIGELLIKVGCVNSTRHSGLERWLNLLVPEFCKIDVFGEERMVLDILGAVDAKSLARISVKQTGQKRPGFRTNAIGEAQRFGENLAVHLVGVFVVEGRKTSEHFVQEDTKSPPINAFSVAVTGKKFRSKTASCQLILTVMVSNRHTIQVYHRRLRWKVN